MAPPATVAVTPLPIAAEPDVALNRSVPLLTSRPLLLPSEAAASNSNVPVPLLSILVSVAELARVSGPPPVTVLPLVSSVALTPESTTMPRFAESDPVKPVANCKAPLPLNVMFAVGVAGAAPSAASALMLSVPPAIVVPPEKVFEPASDSVPVPTLTQRQSADAAPRRIGKDAGERSGARAVVSNRSAWHCKLPLLATPPAPVSDPMLWLNPFNANRPPLATETADIAGMASARPVSKMPLLTVVLPLYEFGPARIQVPVPLLIRESWAGALSASVPVMMPMLPPLSVSVVVPLVAAGLIAPPSVSVAPLVYESLVIV